MTPITAEGVAALETLVRQLRDVARKATEGQSVLTTRLAEAKEKAANWHARFQQVKAENNALRQRLANGRRSVRYFTLEELNVFEGYAAYCLDGLEDDPAHADGPPALAKLRRVIAEREAS